MARNWFRDDYNEHAGETPDYAKSDHAQIVGYQDESGRWRNIADDDWRPPREEDLDVSDKYLIAIDPNAPDTPANMPNMVQWIGTIDPDGPDLQDIYDYYLAGYEELAG